MSVASYIPEDLGDLVESEEAERDFADAELERAKEQRECRCPIPLDRSIDERQHDELCLRWQGGDR